MSKFFSYLAEVLADMFRVPKFSMGARVNLVRSGGVDRVDGRVLAQTQSGVLVEWPRHGQTWEDPHHICAQVA